MNKKRSLINRFLASFVALTLFGGSFTTIQAADLTVRRVSVFQIEGTEVILSRGTQNVAPREGQRLASGNVLTTGPDTHLYLQIDGNSLAKMGEASQIGISTINQNLTLTLQSGNALIHIEQGSEQETVTRISNVGLTVRGTMYTANVLPNGGSSFVMLAGLGDVEGIYLYPGYAILISYENDMTIVPITMDILDDFTLQAIVANSQYLLQNSDFVTPLFVRQVVEEMLARDLVIEEMPPITAMLPTPTHTVAVAGLPTTTNVPGTPGVQETPSTPAVPGVPSEPEPAPETPSEESGETPNGTPGPGGQETGPGPGEIGPGPEPDPDPGPGGPGPGGSDLFDGLGTQNSPFLLRNFDDLQRLEDNGAVYLAGGYYFRLVSNITIPAGQTFMFSTPFNGTFDGNLNTITIAGSALFDVIESQGAIQNLDLAGSDSHNGASLAIINHGRIENVISDVNNINNPGGDVGGLVVINHGTIDNSAVTYTSLIGDGFGAVVGGIAARNQGGLITRSAVIGGNFNNTASANGTVGGISGQNTDDGNITYSYSMVVTLHGGNVGGITGVSDDTGRIRQVFVAVEGQINGTSSAGGIIGLVAGTMPPETLVQNSLVGSISISGGSSSRLFVGSHGVDAVGDNRAISGVNVPDNPPQNVDFLYAGNFGEFITTWNSSVWDISPSQLPTLSHLRATQPSMPQIPMTLSLVGIFTGWLLPPLCLCDPCYCYECECYELHNMLPVVPILPPALLPDDDDDLYKDDEYEGDGDDYVDEDDDNEDEESEEDPYDEYGVDEEDYESDTSETDPTEPPPVEDDTSNTEDDNTDNPDVVMPDDPAGGTPPPPSGSDDDPVPPTNPDADNDGTDNTDDPEPTLPNDPETVAPENPEVDSTIPITPDPGYGDGGDDTDTDTQE